MVSDPDWDHRADDVSRDQRAAYDAMRARCPVAYSDSMGWSLFRHDDVVRVLEDHETFSNAVSQHLSVPNGMDPPEHTIYRSVIEPYFSPERMTAFEPACRAIAADLIDHVRREAALEFMTEFAVQFAARVQCAFLGWPASLHEPLISWTARNHQGTLAEDRPAMSQLAREFEAIIDEVLETRRSAGVGPDADITASLMHEKVSGRTLSNEEIASILRNWTVGEIGTIAASAGIITHALATFPALQAQLREQPAQLPGALDEILRVHGPLATNRRVTTCPVELGGRNIGAGEPVTLNWIAANRDPEAFEAPETIRPDRDPAKNLLYGAGIHVCPGAPLARLELRVLFEEMLARTRDIVFAAEPAPVLAAYPASGYSRLGVQLQ